MVVGLLQVEHDGGGVSTQRSRAEVTDRAHRHAFGDRLEVRQERSDAIASSNACGTSLEALSTSGKPESKKPKQTTTVKIHAMT